MPRERSNSVVAAHLFQWALVALGVLDVSCSESQGGSGSSISITVENELPRLSAVRGEVIDLEFDVNVARPVLYSGLELSCGCTKAELRKGDRRIEEGTQLVSGQDYRIHAVANTSGLIGESRLGGKLVSSDGLIPFGVDCVVAESIEFDVERAAWATGIESRDPFAVSMHSALAGEWTVVDQPSWLLVSLSGDPADSGAALELSLDEDLRSGSYSGYVTIGRGESVTRRLPVSVKLIDGFIIQPGQLIAFGASRGEEVSRVLELFLDDSIEQIDGFEFIPEWDGVDVKVTPLGGNENGSSILRYSIAALPRPDAEAGWVRGVLRVQMMSESGVVFEHAVQVSLLIRE